VPPGYGVPNHAAPARPGAPAGFWRRFGGTLLDGILYGLLWLPFAVVGFVLIFVVGLGDCSTDRFTDELVCDGRENVGAIVAGSIVLFLGWVFVAFLYVRALAKRGQTWGRHLVGVRVVDATTGGAPGWGKAIGRTLFASFISGNFCYLGYLWMLWDAKRQTWHDKVAGTLVVET
jgi:uncharacterized RDD family membrane protein YckC